MFLWKTPRARVAFGTTPEFAEESATLAANQGFYNGFPGGRSHLRPDRDRPDRVPVHSVRAGCVIVAGLYGAATASRRILVVQVLPGALAPIAVLLAR
jgi:putative membrane protein